MWDMEPRKGPSWHWGTKGHWMLVKKQNKAKSKTKNPGSSLLMLLEKYLDQKGKIWKLIGETSLKCNQKARKGNYHGQYLHLNTPFKVNTDPNRKRHNLRLQQKVTTSTSRRKYFPLPVENSAKGRQSQFSQWKDTILQTPNFLQWTFCL